MWLDACLKMNKERGQRTGIWKTSITLVWVGHEGTSNYLFSVHSSFYENALNGFEYNQYKTGKWWQQAMPVFSHFLS